MTPNSHDTLSPQGAEVRKHSEAIGYLWSAVAVAGSTAVLWLCQGALDKGQASLLYLPMVLFCAIRFGYGQSILAAILSFLCWDFFFLPPRFTFTVVNRGDMVSLVVFLIAAVSTAQLSSRIRRQAAEAQAREREIATLFRASEAISVEIDATRIIPALAEQIVTNCRASRCVVLRSYHGKKIEAVASVWPESRNSDLAIDESREALMPVIERLAAAVLQDDQPIGFSHSRNLWKKALESLDLPEGYDTGRDPGVYLPLRAQSRLVGVLHVGPRIPDSANDARGFSGAEQRLIYTMSNNAAVVLARQLLSDQAAEAEALRQADALKDSLLSMVSHELRTPLAAIKASASGLRQPGSVWDSADRDAAIRAIDVESDRLIAVVNNLLDLSRLEGGAWEPNREWCEIPEIVGTVLGQLPSDADRVDAVLPEDLPLVKADYVQIALVLTNLLQNALKYSEPGGRVELTARTEELPLAASEDDKVRGTPAGIAGVRVAVRDHGSGLTAGEGAKIFERFYRGERHRHSTVHGTGIGLTLCRAVVQAHRGKIEAENAEGGGAVFSFILPIE